MKKVSTAAVKQITNFSQHSALAPLHLRDTYAVPDFRLSAFTEQSPQPRR